MEIVILLGAPGSGKGTIASRLAGEDPAVRHVSSGDLLRGAIAAGTPAGVEAKAYMDKGQLVPDALVVAMIGDVIAAEKTAETMLLDGFPRNVAQAEALERSGAKVRSAVLVDVPDEIIADRIAGRRTCPKCKAGYHVKALPPKVEGICDKCGEKLTVREDDKPETVRQRLAVYHAQTEPIIGYYAAQGKLKAIDGTASVEETSEKLVKALEMKQ